MQRRGRGGVAKLLSNYCVCTQVCTATILQLIVNFKTDATLVALSQT